MADFSKLNGYNVKDATAREAIAALEGGSYFLGVTTTAITDQATTNPITIDGEAVTAKNGNMVIYGNKEFVWSGTESAGKWVEFGDLSVIGDLGYADTASASYTPAGSVALNADTVTSRAVTSAGSVEYDSDTEALTITMPTIAATDSILLTSATSASFTGTQATITVEPDNA